MTSVSKALFSPWRVVGLAMFGALARGLRGFDSGLQPEQDTPALSRGYPGRTTAAAQLTSQQPSGPPQVWPSPSQSATPAESRAHRDVDRPPRACVIGVGVLGKLIIAELLLLGSEVSVYDKSLSRLPRASAQAHLDRLVRSVLRGYDQKGLLREAGLGGIPDDDGTPWSPIPNEPPRRARFCASIGDAAKSAEIVLEAVPDQLEIKRGVLAEAAAAAPPGTLLATNTLSLPIAKLSEAVRRHSGVTEAPRVVGLRFLVPVSFVPFVEVTLTSSQMEGADRSDLLAILHRWGKAAFQCDVQDAAGSGAEDPCHEAVRARCRTGERLRLDPRSVWQRQRAEARLRAARRAGPEAVARLTPGDVFDFAEETCCVCMDAPATVASVLCGHRVVCGDCSELVVRLERPSCLVCRVRFLPAIRAGGGGSRADSASGQDGPGQAGAVDEGPEELPSEGA